MKKENKIIQIPKKINNKNFAKVENEAMKRLAWNIPLIPTEYPEKKEPSLKTLKLDVKYDFNYIFLGKDVVECVIDAREVRIKEFLKSFCLTRLDDYTETFFVVFADDDFFLEIIDLFSKKNFTNYENIAFLNIDAYGEFLEHKRGISEEKIGFRVFKNKTKAYFFMHKNFLSKRKNCIKQSNRDIDLNIVIENNQRLIPPRIFIYTADLVSGNYQENTSRIAIVSEWDVSMENIEFVEIFYEKKTINEKEKLSKVGKPTSCLEIFKIQNAQKPLKENEMKILFAPKEVPEERKGKRKQVSPKINSEKNEKKERKKKIKNNEKQGNIEDQSMINEPKKQNGLIKMKYMRKKSPEKEEKINKPTNLSEKREKEDSKSSKKMDEKMGDVSFYEDFDIFFRNLKRYDIEKDSLSILSNFFNNKDYEKYLIYFFFY